MTFKTIGNKVVIQTSHPDIKLEFTRGGNELVVIHNKDHTMSIGTVAISDLRKLNNELKGK